MSEDYRKQHPVCIVSGWANLSDNGQHRYELGRFWTPGPMALFIMLNPSTADATEDDPTIRRCMSFARREGCGSLVALNLYSYRTPDPADLEDAAGAGIDVTGGERNAAAFARRADSALRSGGPVIAAWGAYDRRAMRALHARRVAAVRETFPGLRCLGTTKAGHPRHPLYLSADTPLSAWPPEIGGER